MFKPFKPLTLKRPEQAQRSQPNASAATDEPPLKKRKANQSNQEDRSSTTPAQPQRRPPLHVKSPAAITIPDSPPRVQTDAALGQYTVLWRKKTNKKNKTWDGDGFLKVSRGYATLQDLDGKDMGRTKCDTPLLPGSTLTISGKDVEIDAVMSKEETQTRNTNKPVFVQPRSSASIGLPKSLPVLKLERPNITPANIHSKPLELPKRANTNFKNPMLQNTVARVKSTDNVPVPRHNPDDKNALVMKRPTSVPKGKQIVDVVVDPILCKHLREHQRSGVAFMYECVMGMRPFEGEGAILADEMGLGKTLQTIALVWTLLKQSPVWEDGPVVKKVLIVCPATLINNWRKEFRKWLGNERIGVLVAESNKTRFTDFTKGKSYSVMIIGYEKLRNVQAELQKGSGVDIVIADEGHRLKSAQNKSALAIKSLNTERRIILSGTPIQNDLSEFYSMVDFVNPGLLNKYSIFKKDFENPILKSRQPGASAKDIEKGQSRSEELAALTGQFILRRTAEILAKYLPPKTEYVVYCRPTDVQIACYEAIISTGVFDNALKSSETSFQLINILKKVCNSPKLLKSVGSEEDGSNALTNAITGSVPSQKLKSSAGSSKLHALDSLLHTLHTTTSEKVVVVSNYTATLDMLGKLMTAFEYPFLRLDGSTPVAQRQDLVDRFNRSPSSSSFVFLLSAKAGGVGINLIGASRLVLYDIDWNPAIDLQAMARIHRDGQKHPCYIYRLLTKGALEEKIYQRQLSKQDLSDTIVDNKVTSSSFSPEELRDLFTLDRRESCQTHDLINCPCGGRKATCETGVSSAAESEASSPKEVEDVVDSDDDLPEMPTFIRSSQIDLEAEERKREQHTKKEETKGKLQSLMRYAHIDATLFRGVNANVGSSKKANASTPFVEDEDEDCEKDVDDDEEEEEDEATTTVEEVGDDELTLEAAIEDDVLRAVIAEEGSRVDFVFSKTNS